MKGILNSSYWSLLLLFLSFTTKAQESNSMFNRVYDQTQLREDISFVKQKLEEQHPNLYWYIKKSKLNYKFDSLNRSIKAPITLVQFRHTLACVLASIGDGHMSLMFDQNNMTEIDKQKFDGGKLFPLQQFEYEIFDGKLYIVNSKSSAVTKGSEVVAINNQPAMEVLAKLASSLPSDGYNNAFKYFCLKSRVLPEYYTVNYGFKDTVSLQLKYQDSLTTIKVVSASGLSKVNNTPSPFTITETRLPGKKDFPAYIRIGTFVNSPDDLFNGFFEAVKRDSISCVMLDLRGNTGGDHLSMIKLFSYFISKPTFFSKIDQNVFSGKMGDQSDLSVGTEIPVQPAVNHYDGKLYVFINEGCFSAASLLAANLQGLNKAVFIGQETGGGRNGCVGGIFDQSSLPNTGLLLRFGKILLKIPKQTSLSGRGVIPDVTTTYTIDDFMQKKDLEYDWVRKQLWPENK